MSAFIIGLMINLSGPVIAETYCCSQCAPECTPVCLTSSECILTSEDCAAMPDSFLGTPSLDKLGCYLSVDIAGITSSISDMASGLYSSFSNMTTTIANIPGQFISTISSGIRDWINGGLSEYGTSVSDIADKARWATGLTITLLLAVLLFFPMLIVLGLFFIEGMFIILAFTHKRKSPWDQMLIFWGYNFKVTRFILDRLIGIWGGAVNKL